MPKNSDTVQLVLDIEMLTGSSWGEGQRYEVAELIRKYRFQVIVNERLRVQKLLKNIRPDEFSDKILSGNL